MKNKAIGVLVRMVKIMQVLGSYVIKRCNKLSLRGKLRRSMVKNVICKGMNTKVEKKENVYVLGKLKPK